MSILNNLLNEIKLLEKEAEGWKDTPKGWTGKSIKKYAKSLTGKKGGEKGFFDKCVEKMKGKIDDPEAYCASVKDETTGSTHWRGKDKSPQQAGKDIKKHQNVKREIRTTDQQQQVSKYLNELFGGGKNVKDYTSERDVAMLKLGGEAEKQISKMCGKMEDDLMKAAKKEGSYGKPLGEASQAVKKKWLAVEICSLTQMEKFWNGVVDWIEKNAEPVCKDDMKCHKFARQDLAVAEKNRKSCENDIKYLKELKTQADAGNIQLKPKAGELGAIASKMTPTTKQKKGLISKFVGMLRGRK